MSMYQKDSIFMNRDSGSVDTYENWVADFEYAESKEDERWPIDVDGLIKKGALIEVYCNPFGDYVEVE